MILEIKRDIYPLLEQELSNSKILLLIGPRQVGKTTLMRRLQEQIPSSDFIHLNLDIEDDFAKLKTQKELLTYLKLEIGDKSNTFVFIDEIQRKENAGLFMKGLYDMKLPYKFILTGSGSVELKEKVSEGLAGRKNAYTIYPVAFSEFVNYKTDYKYENKLTSYLEMNDKDHSFLTEYLEFGGYPEIITNTTRKEKQKVMESIYESFIDKDIKELLEVQDTSLVNDILTFLSGRMGQITTLDSITNITNIKYTTLKEYLYYLDKTFIIDILRPYFTNPEKELTKTPTYYYNDLGMRNYIFNRLNRFEKLISGSMLFQNFVYKELLIKDDVTKLNFWRTKDKAEVDLIVTKNREKIPVEVKYKSLSGDTIGKSMYSYIRKYNPPKVYFVNLDYEGERDIEGTKVIFIPYTKLLSIDL